MVLVHDTEVVLKAAATLINGVRNGTNDLGSLQKLDAFLADYGTTGRRDRDAAELASIHSVRTTLAEIWASATDEVRTVGLVNELLQETRATPWLTRHAEMPEWHLHLASLDDPLHMRLGAETAMAMADLIRSGELGRLKICAAPECDAVLLDLSRNRSRIFCDTGNCGNRLHVAAYRERRAADG